MTDARVVPSVVWHASREPLERPTVAGRQPGPHHANSGLGLFCAAGPFDYVIHFGPHVHELTLQSNLRALALSVPDLRKMGQSSDSEEDWTWEGFAAEGRRLAQTHDVILLMEATLQGGVEGEAVSQVIVLHDRAIQSSRAWDRDSYARIAVDPSVHLHAQANVFKGRRTRPL